MCYLITACTYAHVHLYSYISAHTLMFTHTYTYTHTHNSYLTVIVVHEMHAYDPIGLPYDDSSPFRNHQFAYKNFVCKVTANKPTMSCTQTHTHTHTHSLSLLSLSSLSLFVSLSFLLSLSLFLSLSFPKGHHPSIDLLHMCTDFLDLGLLMLHAHSKRN